MSDPTTTDPRKVYQREFQRKRRIRLAEGPAKVWLRVKRLLRDHPEFRDRLNKVVEKMVSEIKPTAVKAKPVAGQQSSKEKSTGTWESRHPNGLATIDGNEDTERN